MDIWIFCPQCIDVEAPVYGLAVTYYWSFTIIMHVPICTRLGFQSISYSTTICISTRLIIQYFFVCV